jgi:hypothetical protein
MNVVSSIRAESPASRPYALRFIENQPSLQARRYIGILAAALVGSAVAAAPAPAGGRVAVVVVKPFPVQRYASSGAVGLLVPGSGTTVTRAGALAALVRGRVQQSLLGGRPGGKPLITLSRTPGPITIYVALPPPERRPNTHRYPIAVVGGGYHGLLTSSATRIPGLVSIADVAPTARDLAQGKTPALRSRPDPNAAATLRRLDRRLATVHGARTPATLVLVGYVLFFSGLAIALWSGLIGRAAVLVAPVAIASSIALSGAHVARVTPTVAALALATGLGSLGAAAVASTARRLGFLFLAFLVALLVVLVARPEVNALAALGPHPDGGGRFYGITNQVETLLLVPILLVPALLGTAWLVPTGALALVALGWSRAGADGGGAVVIAVGLLVLWLRLRGSVLTWRRALGIVAAAVLLVAALAGLDAALGGSSHVTKALGSGPGSLAGDLAHRLHVSQAGVTSSWWAALSFSLCIVALAWLWSLRPRFPAGDAFICAVCVSLLVNDTGTDISWFGALSGAALWSFWRVRSHAFGGLE